MEVVSDVLFQRLAAILFAATFGLLVARVAWKKGYFILPPENPVHKDVPDWKTVLIVFALFLSIEMFLVPTVYFFWLYIKEGSFADPSLFKLADEIKGWANLGVIGITFLALLIFYLTRDKPTRDAVWGSPKDLRSIKKNIIDFFVGSITWVIAYPWIIVIGQTLAILMALFYTGPLPDQAAVQHLKDIYEQPLLFGATAVAVVSIIPFIEELIFRGFLQSWLKTTFGRNIAILVCSLIFAVFHFSESQGIENIEFISSLFFFSCFLGFVKERQNSLWASIGLHITFNLISILMLVREL